MFDKKPETLTNEQLSQLMDGEWHDIDAPRCVADACRDDELRHTWGRWHMIRDIARGEPIAAPEQCTEFASRIQSLVADEPTYSNVTAIRRDKASDAQASAVATDEQPVERRFVWPQAAAGLAIAASVAAVTVMGLNLINTDQVVQPEAVMLADNALSAPTGAIVAPELAEVELVGNTGSYWIRSDDSGRVERSYAEERLNMFLSQHLEHSPTAQRAGMLPYSSLVSYEERTDNGDLTADR